MQEPVLVAGVGMTPFKKPGDNLPYPEMAALAIRQADYIAEQMGAGSI